MNNDHFHGSSMNNGRKFDICLMNPPYANHPGDGLYVKFLNKCINITNNLISINPDGPITGHGSGSLAKYAFKEFRENLDSYNFDIELIDGKQFDAAIKSNICIIKFDRNKDHNIHLNYYGHEEDFDKQKDINIFFYNDYLVEFDKKIRKYVKENGCIEDHMKLTAGYGDFVKSKLKEINPDKSKLFVYFLKPNASFPYAKMKKNDLDKVKEYNDEDQYKKSMCYVEFDKSEKNKAENFLNYLDSDLVKLCIKFSTLSNIQNINRYTIIPWLDFSKSYTDEELFEMIGMKYDKEEIDKILKK